MSNELTTTDTNSYLAKDNFEHYFRMASMIGKSDMVPKAYKEKPQDILLAMEYGRALGLGPLQAIQNIAVINSRPCLYGDGILAVCSGHPDFEDIKEEPILDSSKKVIGYTCIIKRKGRSPVSQSFTIEQATAAGLWGRQGPWKSFPERMLQMRARSFALRDSFADALGGVRVVEEVQDYKEVKNITPMQNRADIEEELKTLIDKNNQKIDSETGEVLQNEGELMD